MLQKLIKFFSCSDGGILNDSNSTSKTSSGTSINNSFSILKMLLSGGLVLIGVHGYANSRNVLIAFVSII